MGVIETGKDIAKLAQQLGSIEIQQKVIELQGELLKGQEEVQALRKENEKLKDVEKIDSELVLRENAYWRDSQPETRRGPFCTGCWGGDQKLIPLVINQNGGQKCPQCEKFFPTAAFEATLERMQQHSISEEGPRGLV